jgi:hypothetical protein
MFCLVSPCGFYTNVSEAHTTSIFRAEDGGKVFLQNIGIYSTYKSMRPCNTEDEHGHLHRRKNLKIS